MSTLATTDFTRLLNNFRYLGEGSKGAQTILEQVIINDQRFVKYINEFWTSRQRQCNGLHEVAYRACFKGQLPGFFIEHLTKPGDIVYDPFSGRGTTLIEAALQNRNIISNDINPLNKVLCRSRLFVPTEEQVQERLLEMGKYQRVALNGIDLSMFYHPETDIEIRTMRSYMLRKGKDCDFIDDWIRMIATNRLTGHSAGFFSVYTLPPNQAVSASRQIKINAKRQQKAEYRDTQKIVLRKSNQLKRHLDDAMISQLEQVGSKSLFLNNDASKTFGIPDNSVALTVTSPPFLDVVQYSTDNWLRCWFNGIDHKEVKSGISFKRKVSDWEEVMSSVIKELHRITRPGGHVAFEVGEVRKSSLLLEDNIIPLGLAAGFQCDGVMIHQQDFTKTANIWGIKNNDVGTNSHRIVLFRK